MTDIDIRTQLLRSCRTRRCSFVVTAMEPGVLAGMESARRLAAGLGVEIAVAARDGNRLRRGQSVFQGSGSPVQVAKAEELLLGCLGKASGIASAAAQARVLALGRGEVVCGAWKKVFPEVKDQVRAAVRAGGLRTRLVAEPMIYLDKNYVRMLGGVGEAVRAAVSVRDAEGDSCGAQLIVVQLREESAPIADEAFAAVDAGADVLMVDNGSLGALRRVSATLEQAGCAQRVKLAFGGGVSMESLPGALSAGADIVDVGRAIVDAPLIDFSLDVVGP